MAASGDEANGALVVLPIGKARAAQWLYETQDALVQDGLGADDEPTESQARLLEMVEWVSEAVIRRG